MLDLLMDLGQDSECNLPLELCPDWVCKWPAPETADQNRSQCLKLIHGEFLDYSSLLAPAKQPQAEKRRQKW
eukprot:5577384-Lingulodinium_polyedra.AAC.1